MEGELIAISHMNSLFNEYGRKARLFPALLCSLPFLLLLHFAISPHIDSSLTSKLFVMITGDISFAVVLTYLLAQINRTVSKILFEDKSKFPTTQMLLPSSKELSSNFRQKIEEKVSADFKMSLPTMADEQTDLEGAKTRIKEIVSLIINKVGSGTLLLQHNIEYGFVRNLIGGSVIAFLISIVSSVIFGFVVRDHTALILGVFLTFCYLVPILFSKIILKHYSEEYARILFREYVGS